MSIIDPNAPRYTFSYKELKEPIFKFIKDAKNVIHHIQVIEYVYRHNASNRKDKNYGYAKYKVKKKIFTESKFKRFINKILNKKDLFYYRWIKILPEFYSRDFYSGFMPNGLVQEDYLYNTKIEAENGKSSHIFRDYNLKN